MAKPEPKVGSSARGNAGRGRPRGVPNKITATLKEAILEAAAAAGGANGLVGYLTTQAIASPQSFLPLLGKVLPMTIAGIDGSAIKHVIALSDEALMAIAAREPAAQIIKLPHEV